MSDVVDLNPTHLATVQQILSEHVPDCEVRAFGSRATWTAKDYSDIDLAIVGDGPLDWRTIGDLKEAFEESTLPMRVDVVDWNGIKDNFRQRIEPDCVVIQERLTHGTQIDRVSPPLAGAGSCAGSRLRIGEWAPFSYGKGLPQRKRADPGNIRVYGSNGVVGHHDMPLTTGPTVIIGRKGTVGAVHYSPDPCWPIDTTFYVEGDQNRIVRYVYYALKASNLSTMNSDSAVPGLNRDAVHARSILVPPVVQQRAIAHVLGTLDDKIELNRRMSETLDEMARALFRSWFVDFDPVRAKAQGRPTGLPDNLDALFPDSFEASELGDIPTGWRVKELGDVIDVNPRRRISRGEMATHVKMAAVPTSGPQITTLSRRPYTSGSRFARRDTLFARISPSVENGKVALVDFLDDAETGWGSTELIVLRPKPPWPPEIAYVLVREPSLRDHAIVNMTGTSGRQRVPAEAIAAYILAVPPSDVAVAFGDLVQPWFERATCLGRQSGALDALRDTLLPKLLSGELRVPAHVAR